LTSTCWSSPAGSRHDQAEPDGPDSLANQAIKDQALQISDGRASEAPNRRPGGRAQITPIWSAATTDLQLGDGVQIESSLLSALSSGSLDFLR
jgi:hypothetical protein